MKDIQYDKFAARRQVLTNLSKHAVLAARQAMRQRGDASPSVNLLSWKTRTSGLGTTAGLIEQALHRLGMSVRNFHYFDDPGSDSSLLISDTTISVIGPGQFPVAAFRFPRLFSPKRHRSGVIFWEVDVLPWHFSKGFSLLDELLAPSTFVANILESAFASKTCLVPLPVSPLDGGEPGHFRQHFGIKDEFLVAYQFDMGSSAERKNPVAAVDAFVRAFPTKQYGARLILKCSRAAPNDVYWKTLCQAAAQHSHVLLVNEIWDERLLASMYLDIDCYLSPHRSEGYGLTVAQAIAANCYTIATNYGGVTDLLHPEHSGLVDFDLITVGQNPIYPSKAVWSNPKMDSLVDHLRWAFDNRSQAFNHGRLAGESLRHKYSWDTFLEWFTKFLSKEKLPTVKSVKSS